LSSGQLALVAKAASGAWMLNKLSSTDTSETPQSDQVFGVNAAQGFDLHEGLSFVWRQWKIIASAAAIAVLIGFIVTLTQTPRYTATALVLLDPQRQTAPGPGSEQSTSEISDAIIDNQISITRSTAFLKRVVERIHLVSDPEFGSTAPEKSKDLPAPSSAGEAIPPNVMASVDALHEAITVGRVGLGSIFSISVTSVDPARASMLANAVASGYVVEKLDARFDAAKNASAWLSDRLVDLRKQLRQSEEAVAQFRSDHGMVQSGSNISLNQQQLSDLNLKLVEARNDLAQKKARVDLLRSIKEKGGNIQSLPNLPDSAALQALRAQDAAASQKEADLVARYNDRHPLVVNVRAEHRDIQRAIAAEMQRMGGNVQNEYELAKSKVDALEQSLREATGQTGAEDKTAITLRELERTAAVNKTLFENFLQKAKITQEQSTFDAQDARVITPAQPPGAPSYPKKSRELVIALVIGLLLGVGGALGKEKLMTGFVTPQQVEEILRLPLLASVASMTKSDLMANGKATKLPLVPGAMPLSRFSEAMRMLRSGILMTDVDDPPKVIQVTSAVPSEGKTTIALSMAVSAATSGLRVLFIDADLRHPSATHFLEMQKLPGLVELLSAGLEMQEAVKYNHRLKLWALSAGCKTQNPADILASERMKAFISVAKQSFDVVVIDTAPIGPVIDSIVVSNLVDKVVFVVRWASTARELVQQSVQRFPGHRKVAGIIFNQVNEKLARKYGKHANAYYGSGGYNKYYNG
jgi:capsular exopolysaccharide synthesis family protein